MLFLCAARRVAAPLSQPAPALKMGSGADGDLVLDLLDAVDLPGDAFGGGALAGALGKASEHHGAIQGFNADGRGVHVLVVHEAGFDGGGDGRVVDIGADGFLAAGDGAAGAEDQAADGQDGGEVAAYGHGVSPVSACLDGGCRVR